MFRCANFHTFKCPSWLLFEYKRRQMEEERAETTQTVSSFSFSLHLNLADDNDDFERKILGKLQCMFRPRISIPIHCTWIIEMKCKLKAWRYRCCWPSFPFKSPCFQKKGEEGIMIMTNWSLSSSPETDWFLNGVESTAECFASSCPAWFTTKYLCLMGTHLGSKL